MGVNRFRLDEEEPYEPLRVDPAIEAQQAERLTRLRAERDRPAVDAALTALKKAAEGEDNVLYPMKDALKACRSPSASVSTSRWTRSSTADRPHAPNRPRWSMSPAAWSPAQPT